MICRVRIARVYDYNIEKRMIRCHTYKEELTIRVDLRHRSFPGNKTRWTEDGCTVCVGTVLQSFRKIR
jgi:hypothetical protein